MRKFLLVLFCSFLGFSFHNINEFKRYVIQETEQINGWCSAKKRKAILDVILQHKPKVCVEIGVYEGRSLLPIALALKYNQEGIVMGVDAWSLEECMKNYSSDHHVSKIWLEENLEKSYSNTLHWIEHFQVEDYCNVLRMTSIEAASLINEIDFLHIDGNHSEESTLLDVKTYFEKVVPGGYICLDDANRETTKKAYAIVKRGSVLVRTLDKGNCLIYKKNKRKR